MSQVAPALIKHDSATTLPVELVQILNQAYFLHLLATDPAKLVPPGKSLLSMMTQAHIGPHDSNAQQHNGEDQTAALHAKVTQVVHATFWNEALDALSSLLPSVQLSRLKSLYSDLLQEVSPLLPPTHPVIVSLSSPLPPTSSPLHSTLTLLREIVDALRQRCAPVRDDAISALMHSLDNPPHLNGSSNSSNPSSGTSTPDSDSKPHIPKTPVSPLAQLVIDTIRGLVLLAGEMKSDLNAFVLGAMTEAQLRGVVVQQAKTRERELVLDIWGDEKKDGREAVREAWRHWVGELTPTADATQVNGVAGRPERKWVLRLVQALHSQHPVSCDLPRQSLPGAPGSDTPVAADEAPNELPPQFFFSTPTLLYIQNYLQALVIAASLRSLTRLPPSASSTSSPHDFMHRIWTLLEGEIDDAPAHVHNPTNTAQAPITTPTSDTKLINLADEVVRARRLHDAIGPDEEAHLRAAVERTLRPRDAVFVLLQERLMRTLGTALSEVGGEDVEQRVPERMQTGRERVGERAGERPRLMVGINGDGDGVNDASGNGNKGEARVIPPVKGFEDPVLVRGLKEVVGRIEGCVAWVEQVWGDLV